MNMKDVMVQKSKSTGQKLFRSRKTGRFLSVSAKRQKNKGNKKRKTKRSHVRNGSLYDFKGLTVRAEMLCDNGMRLVNAHKALFGFVKDSDLEKINKRKVNKYLENRSDV